jgi:L-seryl-tRNA(Ser) seleniumtransferase
MNGPSWRGQKGQNAINYLPGIAKVGKEEIIGLMTAVELNLRKDWEAERRTCKALLDRVGEHVKGIPTVFCEYPTNDDYSHSPRLCIQWDEEKLGISLAEMMRKLRDGNPGIIATDMTKYRPAWKGRGIFANNLQKGEEMIMAGRIRQILLTGDVRSAPSAPGSTVWPFLPNQGEPLCLPIDRLR